MQIPAKSASDVFAACVSGILDGDLEARVLAVEPEYITSSDNYTQYAVAALLYTLRSNADDDAARIVGDLTKGEAKSLYSYYLVNKTKPGRATYDVLVSSAPGGVCPLCGVGQATTLDHYLSKAKFPLFAITPANLVPACRDCNTVKSGQYSERAEDQSLHPYFDHGLLLNHQWLSAEVLPTTPASFRFSVNPPDAMDDVAKSRVRSHFHSLELATRFGILAADELSSLVGILSVFFGGTQPEAVRQFLVTRAVTEFGRYPNSWKTATYNALAASDWFCREGFMAR
jgi:hypothetical protein